MAEPDELDGQRLVGGGADATERAAEAALRPKRLEDFTGQEVVRGQLSVVLRSALARGVTADHVLLSGPPGLGKTTLAMIIAAEVDGSLRLTSGPAIQHAGDLAAILSSLEEGDVLFIDEIHRLARTAEEMLYLAMEDFRVDIVVGKGPGATSIPLSLPPFTVVGATTRAGLLPAPLRDRFGFTGHLDYYGPNELTRILTRSAGLLGVSLEADAAKELASRSRGTPESPTGCCAGSRTGRRCTGVPAGWTWRRPAAPWTSSRLTPSGWIVWTARCSRPCVPGSAAARWG